MEDLSFDRIVGLLNKTMGRDRCCRFWQYFLRVIRKMCELKMEKSTTPENKEKYKNLISASTIFQGHMG